MSDEQYLHIDAAAKDGQPKIVRRGNDLARAFWTGDMWAYDLGPDSEARHQVDFEPTHYRELGA